MGRPGVDGTYERFEAGAGREGGEGEVGGRELPRQQLETDQKGTCLPNLMSRGIGLGRHPRWYVGPLRVYSLEHTLCRTLGPSQSVQRGPNKRRLLHALSCLVHRLKGMYVARKMILAEYIYNRSDSNLQQVQLDGHQTLKQWSEQMLLQYPP